MKDFLQTLPNRPMNLRKSVKRLIAGSIVCLAGEMGAGKQP